MAFTRETPSLKQEASDRPLGLFVGRATMLEELESETRPASFLLGEAGVGKSKLLAEMRRRSGEDVFYVACLPNAMLLPLEPLMSVVQKMYRHGRIDAEQARRAIAAKESDRLWYIREVLEAALSRGPLTVQVDDVQWAGSESLNGLQYCVDRLQDLPLRWHIACRCGVAAGEDLAFRLSKAGLARVHRVEGLTAVELLAFARTLDPQETFNGDIIASLHEQTDGNPFYAQLLLAAGYEQDRVIPRDLRRALHDRLSDLSDGASNIAGWFAVDGGCLSAAMLAEMSKQPLADVHASLDELINACIVKHTADGYSFRNALLRDACYDMLDENMRAGCHEVLAAKIGDPWERALHLQAARHHSDAAGEFAGIGWERLDAHAPMEAMTAFSRCLECAEPESDIRWEARAGIASALYGLGKGNDARRAMAGFEATAEALPAPLRVRARARFAESAWDSGQDPEAVLPSVELAMREAPIVAPESLPRLLYVLAAVYERRGELEQARDALERGISSCDDRHVREPIRLRAWLGIVLGRLGDAAAGVAIVESAAAQASMLQLDDEFAHCCTKLCYLCDMLDEHERFEFWCRRGLALSGPKSRSVEALLMSYLADVGINKGRLREALGLSLAAAEKIDASNGPFLCQALCVQAFLYAMLGDDDSADRVLRDASNLKILPSWRRAVDFTAGYAAELRENYDGALDLYALASVCVAHGQTCEVFELRALVATVRVACALKRRETAVHALKLLRSIDGDGRSSVATALIDEADGYDKLLAGDVPGACEKLLLAADADQDPFHKSQLLLAVANARGDRDLFTTVIEALDSMEADRAADRARQLARAHGFRPGRKRQARGNLSPRENSVALLVANGKTNKEIGKLLHVSGRTVEYHIANILTKCGLRSRVEIATRIAGGLPLDQAG
ncbi:MAG: AAA family ATPase [Candidatus Eremiobacteraeota bacterium]|nr:AAA family ATPase [Candidatus Eremiobacteraeota bacterium]